MKKPKTPRKAPKVGEIMGGPGSNFGNEKRKRALAKAKTTGKKSTTKNRRK